jgi:tetratricopeptide (TPR) repeat protein
MIKRIGWIEILFLSAALLGVVCIIGLTWNSGTDDASRRNKDITIVGRAVSPNGADYQEAARFLKFGNVSQAETVYRKLVKKEPDSPHPYLGLARCRTELEDPKNALRYYEKAFEIAPKSPYALIGMGSCYITMSDYPKAIEKYTAALDLDAKIPQAHWGLTVACAHMGRKIQARRHLARFKKLSPDPRHVRELEAVIKEADDQPATQPVIEGGGGN